MKITRLKIISDRCDEKRQDNEHTITLGELKRWVCRGTLIRNLGRYRQVTLLASRLQLIFRPFVCALLIRALSSRRCEFRDSQGNQQKITLKLILQLLGELLRDFWGKGRLLKSITLDLNNYRQSWQSVAIGVDNRRSPVYLRTDLTFDLRSGGSVGHIAGVLNNLHHFTAAPIFLSTDVIPTVSNQLETHIILPDFRFRDFVELPFFFFNHTFCEKASQILNGRDIAFVYQRYSLNNYSGLKLARDYQVPLVLEYNGSEIWTRRNWGMPLHYEKLAKKIELVNLQQAELVVVVSEVIKEELIQGGIYADKILVNPNGVDPQRYSPEIDGRKVRQQYRLDHKIVVGFIGTFGQWHGAEILARAFAWLIAEYREMADYLRLLMIGDGVTMPDVKKIINDQGIAKLCYLTGTIPQYQGPEYLAACDILVSPHVANADGSRFFGSPTKLFEYMAMGKPIVASDLEQIGQILKHREHAWLVPPGNVKLLAQGIKNVLNNPDLARLLAANARRHVCQHYTWKEHTRKICQKLVLLWNY